MIIICNKFPHTIHNGVRKFFCLFTIPKVYLPIKCAVSIIFVINHKNKGQISLLIFYSNFFKGCNLGGIGV